jgi:hypothetical protein
VELVLDIRSHSHKITDECFAFFDRTKMSLHVARSSDNTFSISVDTRSFEQLGSQDVVFHSHLWASSFLVALNMAALGYFCWNDSPSLHPVYRIRDPALSGAGESIALLQQAPIVFPDVRNLTELDVHNALIIFGALSQDADSNSRTEYLKGLLHIGASHMDVTFYREAFGNFYRCMEAFVTRHILAVKQLSNEVKDIQRALKQLGAGDDLLDGFREVYAIRSNQFAHAQKRQVPVAFDDVLKAKAFADLVMCKTYRKRAEEWRASTEA